MQSVLVFFKENSLVKNRVPLWAALIVSVTAAFLLLSSNVKTVILNDGTDSYKILSVTGSIEESVQKLGLKADDYKVLKTTEKGNKITATIKRTVPVTIVSGEKSVTFKTLPDTVSAILETAGITVDGFDMVEPSLDTVITKKAVIDYMNIDYYNDECTEVIPYEVKTVFTNLLSSGVTTSTEGSNGLKLVSYTHKIVNGVEVEKTVNSEQIISKPVKCVKTVGTGGNESITTGVAVTTSNYANCYSTLTPDSPIPLDENGVPTNYTKHVTVQATAYTYTGHNTSRGKTPQPGYIAVNPNVIPYDTKMYIVSSDGNFVYGYAVAADTGGFAYGNPYNVDLFMETYAQCFAFGRRNVEIYFLPN